MKLPPGEGLVLCDPNGNPVIVLDPSIPGMPTITMRSGSFEGTLHIIIGDGCPCIEFRRPGNKGAMHLSASTAGSLLSFLDNDGSPVLRLGYDLEKRRCVSVGVESNHNRGRIDGQSEVTVKKSTKKAQKSGRSKGA